MFQQNENPSTGFPVLLKTRHLRPLAKAIASLPPWIGREPTVQKDAPFGEWDTPQWHAATAAHWLTWLQNRTDLYDTKYEGWAVELAALYLQLMWEHKVFDFPGFVEWLLLQIREGDL